MGSAHLAFRSQDNACNEVWALLFQSLEASMKARAPRKPTHGHQQGEATNIRSVWQLQKNTHSVQSAPIVSAVQMKRKNEKIQARANDHTRNDLIGDPCRDLRRRPQFKSLRLDKGSYPIPQHSRIRSEVAVAERHRNSHSTRPGQA